MALLSLEAMGRRNVAGPLLLLNLALYVSMTGFASWALNSFVDDIGDQEYYPPAGPYVNRSDPSPSPSVQIMTLAEILLLYVYTCSTQCV